MPGLPRPDQRWRNEIKLAGVVLNFRGQSAILRRANSNTTADCGTQTHPPQTAGEILTLYLFFGSWVGCELPLISEGIHGQPSVLRRRCHVSREKSAQVVARNRVDDMPALAFSICSKPSPKTGHRVDITSAGFQVRGSPVKPTGSLIAFTFTGFRFFILDDLRFDRKPILRSIGSAPSTDVAKPCYQLLPSVSPAITITESPSPQTGHANPLGLYGDSSTILRPIGATRRDDRRKACFINWRE